MTEEPIDQNKENDPKKSLGVPSVPSADEVAEAFSTFEKGHASSLIDIPQQTAPAEVVPPPSEPTVPLVAPVVSPEPSVIAAKAPTPVLTSTPATLAPEVVMSAPAATKPVEAPPKGSLAEQALAAKLPEKPVARRAPSAIPTTVAPEKLSQAKALSELSKKPVPAPQSAPATPPVVEAPASAAKTKTPAPSIVEAMRSQASSLLHPLRTFRGDVESSVKENKTSLVTVAAAEENRRASKSAPIFEGEVPVQKKRGWSIFLIAGGVLLMLLGIAALVFVLAPRKAPTGGTVELPGSSLIYTDEVVPFSLAGADRERVMNMLVPLRENTALSLGLIRELHPTAPLASSTEATRASVREFLSYLAPHMSDDLLRTLTPTYVLGVHVYDGNQAFLILTTDSYEQTFSGLVSWEPDMLADLSPLFERRPRPRTPNEQLGTTSAPAVIATGFTDEVVENHDTRVFKDAQGNITLLWTFLNRNTIVITTNERTLAEITSRIRSAPTQGL